MKTTTKATNITLTPAISDYLEKKISKLNKFIDSNDTSAIVDAEIGMTRKGQHSGDIFKAEINLHIAGKSFRTISESGDLYSAIDEAQEEMMESVSHYKNKRKDLIKRGGQKIKEMIKGFRFFRK